MNRRPWTEEDIHRLGQLVAAGVSVARAAVMLKRTLVSTQTQARKAGTPFPTVREVKKLQDAKSAAAEKNSRSGIYPVR
jgi:serine/threonine-protein kinase RIO1